MSQAADPGFFRTVYSARALRRFKPDPIPDDVLFQVLDAAIRAPSGQNAQDWRFLLITDRQVKANLQTWAMEGWGHYRARFGDDAAIEALPKSQRLSLRSVEHLAHNLAQVPVLVLVLGLAGRHSTPGGSAFPAVQNMLLAARAQGLGGSIFNLPLGHRAELFELLGIPENNVAYCLLPLGYPTDRHGPVRRKPVADVVFDNSWGTRWRFAERQPAEGWQDRWLGPRQPPGGA
jgi:nitroreductase